MREKVHTTVMLMLTPDRQMRCLTIVATTLWVCSRTESRQRRSNAQSVGRPPDTNKVRELDLQVLETLLVPLQGKQVQKLQDMAFVFALCSQCLGVGGEVACLPRAVSALFYPCAARRTPGRRGHGHVRRRCGSHNGISPTS